MMTGSGPQRPSCCPKNIDRDGRTARQVLIRAKQRVTC